MLLRHQSNMALGVLEVDVLCSYEAQLTFDSPCENSLEDCDAALAQRGTLL